MKWLEFLKKVAVLPVIDTEILLAGVANQVPIKVQVSRWQKQGKLIQLKRGIYLLAEPYRKKELREFYIASVLCKPSYVSLEKALEYHGLIPEGVPVYTSVTTKSPARFQTKIGTFNYRHIKSALFWGYEPVAQGEQVAFIASPEKALLDFFYLNRGVKVSFDYIDELRLQNLENLSIKKLMSHAGRFKRPGMYRVAGMLKQYIVAERLKEKSL